VTSNNVCEASEHLIALANGGDNSDLVISVVACCHSAKLCTLATQAFRPQQWLVADIKSTTSKIKYYKTILNNQEDWIHHQH